MNRINWETIPIQKLITRNVLYFNKNKEETCRRICQILEIDCFPDLTSRSFWKLKNNTWVKLEIISDNRIDYSWDCFDLRIIELLEKNDNNMVFTSNDIHIDGILHFTNYDNKDVYSVLYKNLNVFERNLRLLLNALGYSYNSFLNYYKHKSKKESNNEFYLKKIEEYSSKKFLKSSQDLQPLEKLDFRELLQFSLSSFHSKQDLNKIGIKKDGVKINIENIGALRNTVMHSKNIKGESSFLQYNFIEFKKFFNSVNEFRELFYILSSRIINLSLDQKSKKNLILLEMLNELDDLALKNYFYSNY
jgi:hypothetical protein